MLMSLLLEDVKTFWLLMHVCLFPWQNPAEIRLCMWTSKQSRPAINVSYDTYIYRKARKPGARNAGTFSSKKGGR